MRILTVLFIFSASFTFFAQDNTDIKIVTTTGGREKFFEVPDQQASIFLNSLFTEKSTTFRWGFTHKFKGISVPDVDGKLCLNIYEGVMYKNGFRTFRNEKNKKSLLASMTNEDKPGILVYVKKKGKRKYEEKFLSEKEIPAFLEYLKNNKKS